jgi:hypothetical protein
MQSAVYFRAALEAQAEDAKALAHSVSANGAIPQVGATPMSSVLAIGAAKALVGRQVPLIKVNCEQRGGFQELVLRYIKLKTLAARRSHLESTCPACKRTALNRLDHSFWRSLTMRTKKPVRSRMI